MSESDKLLSYETAKAMFAEFAEWMPEPGQPMPAYDEETGRYDNKSIERWMNWYADGLVYGVKVPKYDYDPTTEATKTHANAGLVLEMSSPTVAGRNDYLDRKLFMCPRVNGGVDAGGMPYVTAIEGIDERFSCTDANTWALTPVYYVRYEDIPSAEDPSVIAYVDQQFCDSPKEGFVACAGAKLPDGTPRPYILRACYMDTCVDGAYQWSSRSGTVPASGDLPESDPEYGNYSLAAMLEATAQREDGLSFCCAGDWAYMVEFMQLMLGTKAPATCVTSSTFWSAKTAEKVEQSKRLHLNGAIGPVGCEVAVAATSTSTISSASNAGRSKVYRAKVTSVEYASDEDAASWGECYVTLDLDEPIDLPTDRMVTELWWRNGSLDGVLGTYGALDLASLAEWQWQPYRFQNIEYGHGVQEALANARTSGKVLQVASTPPAGPTSDGFEGVGSFPQSNSFLAGDLVRSQGAICPSSVAGTSTEGTMMSFVCSSSGFHAAAFNGSRRAVMCCNPGSMDASLGTSATTTMACSRLSSIGWSAPAE